MKDYGKPIGWWCATCGDMQFCVRHRECRFIRTFAVIPEGERPETHDETDECVEVVTTDSHFGGFLASFKGHDSHWFGVNADTGLPDGSVDPKRINDLAEATAWARR